MQILCAEGDFYEKSILTALGCLLLDRVSLSARNGRRDGEGRTYVYYAVAEICEDFGCSRVTAGKLLSELKRIGRIELTISVIMHIIMLSKEVARCRIFVLFPI